MKRFIRNVVFIMAPVLFALIAVNYWGDAANRFSKDYEKKIAENILKGHVVTNLVNYDERLLQKQLIQNGSICPEVLVVGSSREMLINSDCYKGRTFFNNSVSGASIEDLIAMVELYRQKKCLPRHIVIGLDPWTLNKNNEQTRWRTLETVYDQFIRERAGNSAVTKARFSNSISEFYIRYKELVSASYFKESLTALVAGKSAPFVTQDTLNDTFTKLPDGSINYDAAYREATDNLINEKVTEYLSTHVYSIEKFEELDKGLQQQLEKLTDYLLSQQVTVEYFLVPYHPRVYKFLADREKYKHVLNAEVYFKELAGRKGIKLIGSFDPNKCHLGAADFYDGMHVKEAGIKKIYDNIDDKRMGL